MKSRKFLTTLLAQGMAFSALWFDKLAGGEFVTITIAVLGMYAASNVLEKRNELQARNGGG